MSHKKATWIGTIPLFVFFLAMFAGLCVIISYMTFSFLNVRMAFFLALFLAIVSGILGLLLILNIPIPRKRKNPFSDLEKFEKIAEGAWTKVYRDASRPDVVIKQLYFIGWGHNDYSQHWAPVLGNKICGKWNPLALWVIHNYMILYQLIGLKRRLKFENELMGFPKTISMNWRKLRYEQAYVPYELNERNCPDYICEQLADINASLIRSGLMVDDVHAKNIRVDVKGKIQIVDGELYTIGEDHIKDKLVTFFNGAVVKGMHKVNGNSNIIAWTDHRTSVDEIISQKFS
jgi:hypothetical protein